MIFKKVLKSHVRTKLFILRKFERCRFTYMVIIILKMNSLNTLLGRLVFFLMHLLIKYCIGFKLINLGFNGSAFQSKVVQLYNLILCLNKQQKINTTQHSTVK